MEKKLEQLKDLHNAFFQDDESNFKTMMAGFAMSAVCMLMIFGIYQT